MALAEHQRADTAGRRRRDGGLVINTRAPRRAARGPHQIAYTKAMRESDLTFGIGPAGTGKTYLAVAAWPSQALASDAVRPHRARASRRRGGRAARLPAGRPHARRSTRTCGRCTTRSTR